MKYRDTQTRRKEGHETTEAEIGVMQLQAKEGQGCLKVPEAERGKEGFFPRVFRGSTARPTP